ncbi:MAG: hypothetical protein M3Q91_10595 [Acidobacteriota bacterium]|jgi:hypothetical protein|nr:hypothetical protein [Acidobacteriota bacterium]
MWNLDLYSRLDLADARAIIGPINWYAPTINLKLISTKTRRSPKKSEGEKLRDL